MSKKDFDIEDKLTSWHLILKNNLEALPVYIWQVCRNCGIIILTYEQYRATIFKSVHYIISKYHSAKAFCIFVSSHYFIIYNPDGQTEDDIRCTLAHELVHIALGHIGPELPFLPLHQATEKADAEWKATRFGNRVLCPSIVLHFCSVSSEAEIKNLCAVNSATARIRLARLASFRRDNRFFEQKEERLVVNQFSHFIATYIAAKLTS